jgi:adenylate cyclase
MCGTLSGMGATATSIGSLRAGERATPLQTLAERVRRRVAASMVLAHGLGALDVFLLLFFVLPQPRGADDADITMNLIAAAICLPLTLWLGHTLGSRIGPYRAEWIRSGRAPTADERTAVLDAPLACAKMSGGLWVAVALAFAAFNVSTSAALACHIAITVIFGGITSTAIGYLVMERQLRPLTALALASGTPSRPRWPGVEGRLLLAWLSATGVPFLGLVLVALDGLTGTASRAEVARATLVLALGGFAVGGAATLIAARAVSGPLTAVRRALARVQAGDLAAEVEVDDGSEVGLLQSGFNHMVGGLREREHVQDLFSRQVGEQAARAALEDGASLGGAVCEVAVLFVDIVGSTAMASRRRPESVVAQLNRFFAVVVDVVGAHGGWVNKFEGDAALCVFGAPAPLPDAAGCALAAGRDLALRLRRDLPGIDAGIGLSAGQAVAGWVGAEHRFEYTVIGDPVNEAARLCDLAKRDERRLLASGTMLERAGEDERGRWRTAEETVLRGRAASTRLAVPA